MVSPLDHKLLRDLWRIKGQATAIGAVIAVGVMVLVMMTGLTASLTETRDTYYDRYRLADVFVPVTRSPERVAKQLSQIPGVSAVQTRVVGRALINLPDQTVPVQAQAVSLPDRGRPALNDVYITDGRMPTLGRPDEILLLEGFAAAHGIGPGTQLRATMNGVRRSFDIVGLAQSPEFLYTTAPGELVPDDGRFGVIWMRRSGLAAAYDMAGAFNEALLDLSWGASEQAVIAASDLAVESFGGLGAFSLDDQFSNRFVSEEISGLEAAAVVLPPVFLAVAAFLLYIVVGRMVQSEREEIGLMKAFGYTNAEVGRHYFKFVLVIAVGGAIFGCIAGIGAGRALIGVYVIYFKFPFLVFQIDPAAFLIGFLVSVFAASAGSLFVLRRAFLLNPAVAMRPPTPPNFSRAGRIGSRANRFLDQPSRMVLRRLLRQPVRMTGSVVGIAMGMALSVSMITIYAGFDRTIELAFSVVDRSDLTVSFTHPVDEEAVFELRRVPGVLRVEPVRNVAVVFRNGLSSYRGAVTGLPASPELNRALDNDLQPIIMPEHGILLSDSLADMLGISGGERLVLEIREGRQPTIEVPVAGTVKALLGSPAYMGLAELNGVLREPGRTSGTYLTIDRDHADAIYSTLKDMPSVAGVSLKSEARDAFLRIMNEGAGAIRYVMGSIAFIITFGIVYNTARIALAERARDLASLRVIGFTTGETGFVLLGELAVITLLALPLGAILGYYLSFAIAAGFSTDLYQIPAIFDPLSYGQATLVVVCAAAFSGWLVKRDLDNSDLVAALKTQE